MKEKLKQEVVFERAVLAHLKKSQTGIFTYSNLDLIFSEHSVAITFDGRLPTRSYLKSLIERNKLKEYKFPFPSRKETRYTIGNVTAFALAQSLKPEAYLTHRSTMYIHGLIDEFPETIYINVEQAKAHQRDRGITQEGITRAFKGNVRVSNEIAESDGVKVCVLHGQRTNQLGVIERKFEGDILRVTNVERTLIDITVRPVYAGGVKEVLGAFKRAKGLFKVEELSRILTEMDYAYPYYQAIGFYLENSAAYTTKEIDLFEQRSINYDFYLTHKMGEANFSEKWRLHYPKDITF
jgi:predicted transcriptional regulator of viral defense system